MKILEGNTVFDSYDIVVLSVGGNDLCDSRLTCEEVVEGLLDVARLLLTKYGVKKVIVCQLLYQSVTGRGRVWDSSAGQYNGRVDRVNAMLT
jgi:hypothetical protein